MDSVRLARYLGFDTVDPWDFTHLIPVWAEEEDIEDLGDDIDPGDLTPDDLTPKNQAAFEKWLNNSDNTYVRNSDNPFDQPAYLHMDFSRHVSPSQWLVHFTDDAEGIADKGFKYGSEIDGLHLTTWRRDRKTPGTYAFAFETDAPEVQRASYNNKYGHNAVMFQSNAAILAHHWGDEEQQVVFDRSKTRNRVPILFNTNVGKWEVSTMRHLTNRKNNRVLYSNADLGEVVLWVEKNFARYGNLLMWRGEKGKISPVVENVIGMLDEVDITDSHTKGFVEFYDKYSQVPESDRAGLWVRFAPSTMHKMATNNLGIHENPMGLYVFPLDFVLKNPHQLTYGTHLPYLHVLRSDVDPVDLRAMSAGDVQGYMFGSKWKGDPMDHNVAEYLVEKRGMMPGKAFMAVVSRFWSLRKTKDKASGKVTSVEYVKSKARDSAYQRRLLLGVGITAVKDIGDSHGDSTIHSGSPQQAIFLNPSDLKLIEVFVMGNAMERPGDEFAHRSIVRRDSQGKKYKIHGYWANSHGDTEEIGRRTGTLKRGSAAGRIANDKNKYSDNNATDIGPFFNAESKNQTKYDIESKTVHMAVSKLFPGAQQVAKWTAHSNFDFVGSGSDLDFNTTRAVSTRYATSSMDAFAFVDRKTGQVIIGLAWFEDLRDLDNTWAGNSKVQNSGRSIPAVLALGVYTESGGFATQLPYANHKLASQIEMDSILKKEEEKEAADKKVMELRKFPPVSDLVSEFLGLYKPNAKKAVQHAKLPEDIRKAIESYRVKRDVAPQKKVTAGTAQAPLAQPVPTQQTSTTPPHMMNVNTPNSGTHVAV